MTSPSPARCAIYPEITYRRTPSGNKAKGKNAGSTVLGYRFAFYQEGESEPMLPSNGCYPTEVEARRVAMEVNRLCFANFYPVEGAPDVSS
jgi:hypothetical protein